MRVSASLIALGSVLLLSQAERTECQTGSEEECPARRIPQTCSVVYAPISETEEEWGVFSVQDRPKGVPVWDYGDIVIQVPDANQELQKYISPLAWNGQETGGQYEGFQTVHSLVPGLGMMSRTTTMTTSSSTVPPTLLPFVPRVDEGGLTRFDFAGSGAITHYHNYTWFFRRPISTGDEIYIENSLRRISSSSSATERSGVPSTTTTTTTKGPSLEFLYSNGYCLDNLRPGKSRLKEAGRGAFATREISTGGIVAPVPVLPLTTTSLQTGYKPSLAQEQLLKNYCYGNINSTILLFPYGPIVNLINHFPEYNVRLQWSEASKKYLTQPISMESPPPLLMELVATKPIREGDEIYLHYGREWEEHWYQHKKRWKSADMHYAPSYVMDDAIQMLRTQQEQKNHEYPANVFTSCFYRYSDREESEKAQTQSMSADKLTSYKWKLTKGLYDLKNLRPCQVLRRIEETKNSKGRSAYAVQMLNRPGLSPEEVIPPGTLHIITHVPRAAIRFSDKAGTTDTHIATAFRHEIGLMNNENENDDNLFPTAWMDKIHHSVPTMESEQKQETA